MPPTTTASPRDDRLPYAGRADLALRRSATGLTWLASDHQGTASVAVNAGTQQATVRRQTPFGTPRGAATTWPNDKGFVGGTNDNTGLTHLGAREYDTTLGRFISVDPIQDLSNPQQWNAYAYANNSPVTSSDPSGLTPRDPDLDDQFGRELPGTGKYKTRTPGLGDGTPPTYTITAKTRGEGGTKATDLLQDATEDSRWTINGRTYDRDHLLSQVMCSAGSADQDIQLCEAGSLLTNSLFPAGDHPCGYESDAAFCNYVTNTGNEAALLELGRAGLGKGGGTICAGPNSFTPDTEVLMADGSTKAIKDVDVGDEVQATDPVSGVTATKPVTQLHDNIDNDLADLTVTDERGVRHVIHTTQNHPFWNSSTGKWTPAGQLHRGEHLGGRITVVSISKFTTTQHMLNLTVADIHTYYVLAGTTPVLVHNSDGACFVRGARDGDSPSFVPRPNDYKIDPKTGLVKESHGLSVFDNADSVAGKGFVPHSINMDSVPGSLRVIQRGNDPRHFEIVPAPGANLTPEQYVDALGQIRTG